MPIGTAVHERTFPLCESLNYREWSGYYAPSAYEAHHEHEYNAIRNAAAVIDVTPLYKYMVTGRDATRLVRIRVRQDALHHRAVEIDRDPVAADDDDRRVVRGKCGEPVRAPLDAD